MLHLLITIFPAAQRLLPNPCAASTSPTVTSPTITYPVFSSLPFVLFLLVHITKKEHCRHSTTDLKGHHYPSWAARHPAHCVAALPLVVAR
jgi:hypothetical protein